MTRAADVSRTTRCARTQGLACLCRRARILTSGTARSTLTIVACSYMTGRGTLERNNVQPAHAQVAAGRQQARSTLQLDPRHERGRAVGRRGRRARGGDNDIDANTKGDATRRKQRARAPQPIHHGRDAGIHAPAGRRLLEENDIFANEHAGVGVETGAHPTVRRNRIYGGRQAGAFYYDDKVFKENEVWANEDAGLQIIEAPTSWCATGCASKRRLGSSSQARAAATTRTRSEYVGVRSQSPRTSLRSGYLGVAVLQSQNEIYESDWHGVAITSQVSPTLHENRIFHNRKSGVHGGRRGADAR